ncbi:MAG: glyoxylate/hydroxypyruvate reductase A [Pseudomonadota bacterium]
MGSRMRGPARVLYAGGAAARGSWASELRKAAAELGLEMDLALYPDAAPPDQVDYLLFDADGPPIDLSAFPNLRAILSLWAGVERLLARPDLPHDIPVARMVEPGLRQGMIEYVAAHALGAHLDLSATLAADRAGRWEKRIPPLASRRPVGVMGLGVLGMAVAGALAGLGFKVAGWSRSPKSESDGLPEGVRAHAGPEALPAFLARSEILVVLLPLTAETTGLLGPAELAALPAGAHVINVARGPIVSEAALLNALGPPDGAGRLGGATLDVFDREPLPAGHPFWTHPRVLVTPHVASVTRPETASLPIIRQIIEDRAGRPLRHLVARHRGY